MAEKVDIITFTTNFLKKNIIPFESGNSYIAMLLATLESRNEFINNRALSSEFHEFTKENQNTIDARFKEIEEMLDEEFDIKIKKKGDAF